MDIPDHMAFFSFTADRVPYLHQNFNLGHLIYAQLIKKIKRINRYRLDTKMQYAH